MEPTVAVFSLGGTIAMTRPTGREGVVPALGARQLLDAVPGLADLAVRLEVNDFLRKPGASLTLNDMTKLYREISAACSRGVSGVVVVQGTDTIEETAFFLDAVHEGDAPIVVTGAMRNPTQAGADGPANLTAAIIAAADPAMRSTGCSVAMNDELHAALHVRKTHTTSTSSFQSPATGPFATVRESAVYMAWRPRSRPTQLLVPPPEGAAFPRVAILHAALSDDGYLIEAAAQASDALVLAAFGVGHVPEAWLPALAKVATAMPVALTSRIGRGSVLERTYAFPGSERSLYEIGVINAGVLAPYQARLALGLMISCGLDLSAVRSSLFELGDRA